MSVPSVRDTNIQIKRLFGMEQYTEVVDLCSDTLRLFPDDWKLYYHRAQAKLLLGHRDDAIDDLTAALKIEGREPALYFFRGSWKVEAGNYLDGSDDLMDAINAEASLGTSYYVESARFRRAIAFLHLGEFEKAKGEYSYVRPSLTVYVKGRMWSASEVLDRAQRRVRS